MITNQAVLVVIGVDWEGRRQVLAVELANRESRSSLEGLFCWRSKDAGLHGVEFVVSDDHAGLKAAIREVLTEASWHRLLHVHFLRNALDYVPRRLKDDCLQELRWMYDRRELAEVRRDPQPGSASGRTAIPSYAVAGGQHRGDVDLLPAAAGPSQGT